MRILDLYCCQGGAGKGYSLFGDVTGVDIEYQPRYPFTFVQGDAIEYLIKHGSEFDFIHASPPCQYYSATWVLTTKEYPELISKTRDALNHVGQPWVIENVGQAREWLKSPVMLCGAMFNMQTYRHRFFESGCGLLLEQPVHPEHVAPQTKMGRPIQDGHFGQFIGNFSGVGLARSVMSVPWMSRDGIRECIPPAYSEWVMRQFLAQGR